MTQSARDLESTFARAWALLMRNPVILVPGIVIGVLIVVIELGFRLLAESPVVTIAGNGSADAAAATESITALTQFLISLGLALSQMAYVTGMAGAAWKHGRTSLSDGFDAFANRFAPATGAAFLLLVMGLCAAVLAPVTFGVTLLIYALFFIYTMAAVVIGERPPVAGIVESASTALANLLPTFAVVVLIAVIAAAGGWLGSLAGRVSDLAGWLVAGLLQQVVVAYASLVIAGEYLKLTHAEVEL
ncbi:MAG: hypothetical protein WA629_07865 [Candidatus Aquilonibacter sp.]